MRQAPSKRLQAGFDSRHPLRRARRSVADRRDDTPKLAGSIPAARTFMSCSSSGLGHWSLKPVTRVRFPHTTLSCPCSSADQSSRLRTGVSEVQFLPGALAARMHVDGSRRCSTIAAMTGACGPLSRSRSGIGLDSKSELAEFNSLAACSRGLGFLLADGEREEEAKAQLGESPGDHAFAPSRATAVSYAARRRFNSVRCDEVFRGVAKWYRAPFGTERTQVRPLSPRQRSCRMRDRALPHRGEIQEVHLPRRRVSW